MIFSAGVGLNPHNHKAVTISEERRIVIHPPSVIENVDADDPDPGRDGRNTIIQPTMEEEPPDGGTKAPGLLEDWDMENEVIDSSIKNSL